MKYSRRSFISAQEFQETIDLKSDVKPECRQNEICSFRENFFCKSPFSYAIQFFGSSLLLSAIIHFAVLEHPPMMTSTKAFHLNSSQSNTKVVLPYTFRT